MESNTRQPEVSTRLRLAELRSESVAPRLQFGGGLAGVLTEPAERSAAARWIAAAAVGPEAPAAGGADEVAERLASQLPLSSFLVPPTAPAALSADDLRGPWQAVRARRCDELAAEHASRRLERHRTQAAIEQVRGRVLAPAAADPRAASDPASSRADREVRARLHTLALSIEALVPVPSAEALVLADEWDEHTVLARRMAERTEERVEALEARVKRARAALAMSSGGVRPEARAEIDGRHRLVVEAEAQLFEARRRTRAQAVARYEAAVADEKLALADAGVDSYASFLMTMAGGDLSIGAAAQENARRELDAAIAELDAVRGSGPLPTQAEFDARSVQLRARAERLLGRAVVGGDPPAELRALRVDSPGRSQRIDELAATLREAGIDGGDDPLRVARELLATEAPPSESSWVAAASLPRSDADAAAGRAQELDALERVQLHHERAIAELDAEIARLAAIRDAGLGSISATDVALVMDALVDSYRAASAAGRRLPLVLDGVLDGLSRDAREAALEVLAGSVDVQTIVVTDDLDVMMSLTSAGGTIVLAPEPPAAPDGDTESYQNREVRS